jgi:dihydrolipoamide dehydrogenase
MTPIQHDVVVIGGGPGGYTAALRAAQFGLNVACIEKEPLLGGTCLRVGCIPSKALLESSELFREATTHFAEHGLKLGSVGFDLEAMHVRKQKIVQQLGQGVAGLLKKAKVTHYAGLGKLASPSEVVVEGAAGKTSLKAKHVIIATGSKVAPLRGVTIDGKIVGTSTEALAYAAVPKRLIVIGAGAIGLELGSVWARLGAKVTVLEYLDRILPEMDLEIAQEALKLFKRQNLEFQLGVKVTGARVEGSEGVVECEGLPAMRADRVLVAVGRIPNADGLGLDAIGVKQDQRGRVVIDEHWRTSVAGVYAIGDVVAGPMLAHKAEEEGVACVETIATGYGHVNYNTIPAVVYTSPQVASVGKTEQQLAEAGTPFRKGIFPFRANGRSRILGQIDGMVKMLAHAETDRILGVHIVGATAGDLIAEAAVAMEFGASSEDVARTSHAHPTVAESIKEAALAVGGRALSI